MDEATVERIRANPHFQELVRKRAKLSWILTAAIMIIYFGYFFVVAFAPKLFQRPIHEGSAIAISIPLGVGVIVSGIVLTGIYIWRANRVFDPLTRQIEDDLR